MDPNLISYTVETNVTGAIFGARVAIAGMLEQGSGAFYNMEGLGSNGRHVEGLTVYGTTNRGRNYLTDSIIEEVKESNVIVGSISPGMVMTDLILKQYESREQEDWDRAKRIFNILADRVETITPYLADKMLTNTQNGKRIRWLTRGKIMWRFLSASFMNRNVVDDFEK